MMICAQLTYEAEEVSLKRSGSHLVLLGCDKLAAWCLTIELVVVENSSTKN